MDDILLYEVSAINSACFRLLARSLLGEPAAVSAFFRSHPSPATAAPSDCTCLGGDADIVRPRPGAEAARGAMPESPATPTPMS